MGPKNMFKGHKTVSSCSVTPTTNKVPVLCPHCLHHESLASLMWCVSTVSLRFTLWCKSVSLMSRDQFDLLCRLPLSFRDTLQFRFCFEKPVEAYVCVVFVRARLRCFVPDFVGMFTERLRSFDAYCNFWVHRFFSVPW